MSKKEKKNFYENFDNYFTESEEGEYITKKVFGDEVEKVFIYSTNADVSVSSGCTCYVEATLQGELYGEQFYFTIYRLGKNKVYIYATCNVEREGKLKLSVVLPMLGEYKINVVTNQADVVIRESLDAQEVRIEAGRGLEG